MRQKSAIEGERVSARERESHNFIFKSAAFGISTMARSKVFHS